MSEVMIKVRRKTEENLKNEKLEKRQGAGFENVFSVAILHWIYVTTSIVNHISKPD